MSIVSFCEISKVRESLQLLVANISNSVVLFG